MLLFTTAWLSVVRTHAQCEDRLTDRIVYTVRLDDTSSREGGLYDHMDTKRREELIDRLCDLVLQGRLRAANYWGNEVGGLPDYYSVTGVHLLPSTFAWNETMKGTGELKPGKGKSSPTRDDRVYRDLIKSLSFQEQWHFNAATNAFTKTVNGVILFQDAYTHNIGMRKSYYLPLNDSTPSAFNAENMILLEIIYDVPVTPRSHPQREEYNWWHDNLEASSRERFFDLLTQKALYDTIVPLEVRVPRFPFDSIMVPTTDLSRIYYGRSNWYNSDPLLVGMTDEKIQACCTELGDWTTVTKIRFHESWYFDEVQLRFEKKVRGIGLIVDTYAETGEVNGEQCLVYYRLHDAW